MHSKSNPPKVFISYKWQDEEHNAWVDRLYTDLRTKYRVDAQLDKYEVDFGESFSDYMTGRIDRECEAMLFVITPAAVQAVDKSLSGGVHFEMQLANARKLREPGFRIIGIYREGNENTAYLRDHRYADFRDDSLYEQNLKELADSLCKRRSKPVLGGQGSGVSIDIWIWEDLTSNAPSRIDAAIERIANWQKELYAKRLLAIISDQRTNDLSTRIAAGNALGMLGDPRLDALEMEMIPIPEGTFTMGTEDGEDDEEDDESPQREVYLNAFEIAKYPLTKAQYKAFLDDTGHSEPSDWNNGTFPAGKTNHPVVNISWKDAQAYAEWLSQE
ncbi:MAG: SUMF1/EgtB/PvdO family nonheme iron enzyme, partial [Candidatus Latescibacteria bacterium]|nr:SUMF1/EgtB/PvdO family nonheme iron enzyme [Candidatus Latescibacterota bacterium]